MRFRITLTFNQPAPILFPIDYRFALAAAVYRVMENGDAAYSQWLHDTGFADGTKRFKFFTLSPFWFSKTELVKERRALKITGHEAEFTFSTLQLPMAETFVKGLFANQQITIAQLGLVVRMVVKSVEKLPDPVFSNDMTFTATTPVVVSFRDKAIHRYEQFLPPRDVRYADLLERNLNEKLSVARQAGLNIPPSDDTPFSFILLNEPRKRAFEIIKGNDERPITNIGYTYTFRLKAPAALIETGYRAGFGEQNSFGGYVETAYQKGQ